MYIYICTSLSLSLIYYIYTEYQDTDIWYSHSMHIYIYIFMYIHMYIHTHGIIMYHEICKSIHGRQVPSTLQLVWTHQFSGTFEQRFTAEADMLWDTRRAGTDSWPCKVCCLKSERWIEWGCNAHSLQSLHLLSFIQFIQCSLILVCLHQL